MQSLSTFTSQREEAARGPAIWPRRAVHTAPVPQLQCGVTSVLGHWEQSPNPQMIKCSPFHPNGHISGPETGDIKNESAPSYRTRANERRQNLRDQSTTPPRPTSLLRPKVGELKASSLARVGSESQFSGIDPWVFHLPGALPGEARERHEQNEFGRLSLDIVPGSRAGKVQKRRAWVQGAVWSSWGQLGARCVSSAGHWSPGRCRNGEAVGPSMAPRGWS